MSNFFLWVLVVIAWFVSIYYARQFENWFGRVEWAESNLWGTAQMYVLVWTWLLILWFMTIFWVVNLSK